jgi:hypothetical protein
MPVAHACNPSYSGGSDQEDPSSKPAWASNSGDPILNKTITQKKAGTVAQGLGPEFKPQYRERKKSLRSIVFLGWQILVLCRSH